MNPSRWGTRRPLWYGLGAVLVIALVIIAMVIDRRNVPAPMPGSRAATFQVVGFYQDAPSGVVGSTSMKSFSTHWPQITTVSPLWFAVTPMGTVTNTGYTQSLMRVARAHHRLVVPLFINGGGSTNVLWTSKTRKRAAQNIKATVEKYHLDGINLDFELLNPSSRTDLTKFVADIASELRPLKKVVAVSVFPLVGVPASINGADDYAGLAHYANYLVVMAYDHHYSGGPPGPVAPYAWVEDNVKAALNKVAADKLVLAIGMYGYDWVNNGQAGNAPTVTDVAAVALAKAHGVTPTYDHANSQNTFTYTANGVSHVVWYMGNRSARARVNLAQTDHLSGVALWQLGDEEASFWSVLPSHP